MFQLVGELHCSLFRVLNDVVQAHCCARVFVDQLAVNSQMFDMRIWYALGHTLTKE